MVRRAINKMRMAGLSDIFDTWAENAFEAADETKRAAVAESAAVAEAGSADATAGEEGKPPTPSAVAARERGLSENSDETLDEAAPPSTGSVEGEEQSDLAQIGAGRPGAALDLPDPGEVLAQQTGATKDKEPVIQQLPSLS